MGGLFGGGSKTETVQKPRVERLPDEADPAYKAAAQRSKKQAQGRSGRESTILTEDSFGGYN